MSQQSNSMSQQSNSMSQQSNSMSQQSNSINDNENNENNENNEDISEPHSVTVTELTELIKDLLHRSFNKANLCIIGEISNFKLSKNNVFFTLKDEGASINAVMWNYQSRKDKMGDIKEGKKVKVYGNITLFSKSGTYNLTCHNIELLGVGDLYQQYNNLRDKFTKAGYFDEKSKKKLPSNIGSVGIITAADGAALQDFLYVIKKNNFLGKVYIKNCLVQGTGCPDAVATAIKELDQLKLDLIVVARGGGSFEDLFGFSSEQVVNALQNAKTCTMSAIGHEVDFMLSDFVADIRAPTPSIAGELVSSKRDDILNITEIKELNEKFKSILEIRMDTCQSQLNNYKILLRSPLEVINKFLQDIELVQGKVLIAVKNKVSNIESVLSNSKNIINTNSHVTNGYALVFLEDIQIKSITELIKGKKLKIQFYDGEVTIVPKDIKIVKYE